MTENALFRKERIKMFDYLAIMVSAIAGGVVTILVERVNDRRRSRKEQVSYQEELRRNRPEFQVVKMKDYFDTPGKNTQHKSCDFEVYVIKIENVNIIDDEVIAKYNKDNLNRDKWVCREYTLKNVGKTSVYELDFISHAHRTACLFDAGMINERILDFGSLNYSELYDRRIGPDEYFTLKICFHKDRVFGGIFSAQYELGMRDDNGNYWIQPFFAPDDKLYESQRTTYKTIKEYKSKDIAIKCFKDPSLW